MPGKITSLEAQKRNRKRINVHIDGEFAFGLSLFAAAWLQVGQELSDEKIAELQALDAQEVAYQRALNFISYRERSTAEVRKNLKKHNVDEAVSDDVLERLQSNGLLNDMRFTQAWIENRSEFRPRGRRALAMELRQKGIARDVIEQVLNDIDEDALALRAAQKQQRKYAKLEWQDFRKKMSAFLARRGFSYAVAGPVVKRVWSELLEDENS